MKTLSILLAAGAPALLLACAPAASPPKPQVDTAKIVDAIKTDEVHWNADWAAKDAVKIAAHYAPDAIEMDPSAPPAAGAAAVMADTKGGVDDPGFTLTFASDKVDVAASGDLAAAHGTYKQTSTDPKTKAVVTETGSYVTVYKPQSDGTWKAVWDIATPGLPASVGAAMSGASAANKAAQ
jgi:ketosteroid isomerase-like protein